MACKVLIADDETLARKAIKLQLANYDDLDIAEAANGEEALELISTTRPDIIFLDIQMPGLTGMEVIDRLPSDYQPLIILVTAYDSFAVKAFENEVADFLLKPFTDERFRKAFDRVMSRYRERKAGKAAPDGQFQDLLRKLGQPAAATMTIRDGAKIFVLDLNDILYIEAGGDYLTVVTSEKEYLHKQTLQHIAATLPTGRFVRIHKSTIVNTSFIKMLESHFNGDYAVLLKNGKKLRLSRNFREGLIKALG